MKSIEYRSILKKFPLFTVEKTERVLTNIVQHHSTFHSRHNSESINLEKFHYITLEDICTIEDFKHVFPLLKQLFYPTETAIEGKTTSSLGILETWSPIAEVGITKNGMLVGFSDQYRNKTILTEIQKYLTRTKVHKNSTKVHLTLSNLGIKNEQNDYHYAIKGKRFECLAILAKEKKAITAKRLALLLKQDEKTIWNAIQEINKAVKEKLVVTEDLIIGGYILNPVYKIKNVIKNK